MASALPKRDVSVTWPVCRRPGCGARHLDTYDCPPRGRWLVARFCRNCNGHTYCAAHAAKEAGRPVLTLVRSERKTRSPGAAGLQPAGPGDHDDSA